MPRTPEELAGSRETAELKAQAKALRDARIVALYRDGMQVAHIAQRLGITPKTVNAAVTVAIEGALTDTRHRA